MIGKDINKHTLYIFPALVGKPGLGTTTKTNVLTLLQFGNIFDLKITMDTDYNRYWINQDLS